MMIRRLQCIDVNDDIVIRAAQPQDAGGLQRCMHEAYAEHQERLGDIRLPPLELDYADEIARFPTWVAICADRIAGGLTMVFADDTASVANVAVSPSFQGRGLGRKLLAFAEEQALENHCIEMRLATHVLLTENVDLYRHLGWTEFDRDEQKVYMKKVLH